MGRCQYRYQYIPAVREVRTRNSMSEVGGSEGGPPSAPGASDDSQSSTAAPHHCHHQQMAATMRKIMRQRPSRKRLV